MLRGGAGGDSVSAAGRAWSGASSPGSATPIAASVTIDLAPPRPRAWRSIPSRARRGSRPARSGRTSRISSREHGLTLRHFPQSFEFSTLGGWIATRAGGHFATLYTHIDDLVESVRALTPARRLGEPSAAGLRGGPQPGPPDARLGGNPRGDHRGLGPGPGAPPLEALGRRRIRLLRRRRRGGPGARCSPGSTRQLPAARRGGVGAHPRRAAGQGAPGPGLRVCAPPVEGPMEIALEAARGARRRAR